MTRTRSRTWRALLHLPLLLLMANCPNCFGPPPTLTCDTVPISLEPGTCVEIRNPCANHEWVRLDGFRLCEAPPGLFVQTQRSPRTRFLCADTSVGQLIDKPVEYRYVDPSELGIGQFRVTVAGSPLIVVVSASQSSIPVGGTSQLDAQVSGGAPPYSFSWSGAGLSAGNVASPIASPTVSTQYTVVVTDSIGATANAAVIVNVGVGATAQANPPAIITGQSSNLSVQGVGGSPPYTYSWTPFDSLSAADIANPVATPATRTTYDVTVTDFLGATAAASVIVDVIAPTFTACFTLTQISPIAAQADASCSVGTIVEYRWWSNFRGTTQPPTATTTGPISPVFLYEIPGPKTVRLEVIDASGATSATTLVFTPQ